MAAGAGRGAGCQWPLSLSLHGSLRDRLHEFTGRSVHTTFRGRLGKPIGTKFLQSLQVTGPLPWTEESGLLLPTPADGMKPVALLKLTSDEAACGAAGAWRPLLVPAALTPPSKEGTSGWWTAGQMNAWLTTDPSRADPSSLSPIPSSNLWQPEHRVGLELDSSKRSAEDGQLYAATLMRPHRELRIAIRATLRQPVGDEADCCDRWLTESAWLALGGQQRKVLIAPLKGGLTLPELPDLPANTEGPVLLRWNLITPASFAGGSLPGWCMEKPRMPAQPGLNPGRVRLGATGNGVRKRARRRQLPALPGKAHLIAHMLPRPQIHSGWDRLLNTPKSTSCFVPAGSVYWFLCQDAPTARALAIRLHGQPRSDFHGEKGCGLGLCSWQARLHPATGTIEELAQLVFSD